MLPPQVGHSEFTDRVNVVDIAARGERAVVRLNSLLRLEVLGDVGDVVTVVSRSLFAAWPVGIARLQALGAHLHAGGERLDLHAGVVVIELAVHRIALRGAQIANGITQRRLAAVAHMQWAGRVGRDELDQHLFAGGRLATVRLTSD